MRIPLGGAAGLFSAAAGVGASLVVSALTGGAPTPITAVGTRVIDMTPGAVKDWAIRNLGTNDKLFLLSGIYLVIAVLAAVTGVIAWRSRSLAVALTALLGFVGLAAALADPTTLVSPLSKALPSVVALVVSVGFIVLFTRRWEQGRGETRTRHDNPAPAGFDRRAFLAAVVASGAVAAVGAGVPQVLGSTGSQSRAAIKLPRPADSAPPITPAMTLDNVGGITPYITPTKAFYRVDTALSVPQVDAASWSLKIHGMVDHEVELSFQDILDMPLIERRVTLACVSNEVGGHYAGNATWLGVRTSDLLKRAGVHANADAVESTSVDGMTIGTPLDALTDDREAMIAIGMNGAPLPVEHGFPARMVVPGLYGYVSATKWVVDMEVTTFSSFSAYWTEHGFSEQAPIKTFSRIDVPASFARLKAGKKAVAGVAWDQDTGIKRVEVRSDGGPWMPARLARQDTINSWRQWVYEWEAKPGNHTIEVRSTNQDGYTQTSRRVAPRPDGATGWHSVNVTVT